MSDNKVQERKERLTKIFNEAIESRRLALIAIAELTIELQKKPEDVSLQRSLRVSQDALGFINQCIVNYDMELNQYR